MQVSHPTRRKAIIEHNADLISEKQLSSLASEELHRDGIRLEISQSNIVPNGRNVSYAIFSDLKDPRNKISETFSGRLTEACDRLNIRIISSTPDYLTPDPEEIIGMFKAVISEYHYAYHYFEVDVKRRNSVARELWDEDERYSTWQEYERHRIKISGIRADDIIDDWIARPPVAWAGDPDIALQFTLNFEPPSLQEKLKRLQQSIVQDNALSDNEKQDILGFTKAIEAILNQSTPDQQSLRALCSALSKYVRKVAMRVGERLVIDEIMEFIAQILGNIPM